MPHYTLERVSSAKETRNRVGVTLFVGLRFDGLDNLFGRESVLNNGLCIVGSSCLYIADYFFNTSLIDNGYVEHEITFLPYTRAGIEGGGGGGSQKNSPRGREGRGHKIKSLLSPPCSFLSLPTPYYYPRNLPLGFLRERQYWLGLRCIILQVGGASNALRDSITGCGVVTARHMASSLRQTT